MTKPTLKRHKSSKKNNGGVDRLSQLSDEILLHILSFLPILDAVRTIALRRFGKLWTLLPSLNFDGRIFESIYSRIDFNEDYPVPDDYINLFTNFIRNVLIRHNKVFLDTFILDFIGDECYYNDYESLFTDIMTWVAFAIDRQVKELIVKLAAFCYDKKYFVLPRAVFSSQSLVTLDLSYLKIDVPSQVQMGSLKTLSLKSVKVTNEAFKKIVSGSPSLRAMYLDDVDGLNELRFSAPNMQELQLIRYHGLLDCPNLKKLDIDLVCRTDFTHWRVVDVNSAHLEVVDVSSVQEVRIRLEEFDVFYGLLKKFCDAEVFDFSDVDFKSSELRKLDFPQTRWKRLYIESKLDGDRFLGICNLLRSSPHLEELIILTSWRYLDPQQYLDANMLSLELRPCSMRQLKHVTLRGFVIPCHSMLCLAEFLLRNSVTLEEMVILPEENNSTSAVDVLKYVKKLSSFPRASTNARVIVGSERCTIMQDQDPEVLRWQCERGKLEPEVAPGSASSKERQC